VFDHLTGQKELIIKDTDKVTTSEGLIETGRFEKNFEPLETLTKSA
jgi:hypothetical protein